MNCANHPDRARSAFCQNCGKPLCAECVRNVGSSIFCEPCLVARVTGAAPRPGYGYAGPPPPGAPVLPGEPSPNIAALLGFIPGVGAMYNEQYAKGIVHLIVFAVLVSLSNSSDIFMLFVFGWIAYMAIEAHHTARARRDGTPLPNPFGLNDLSERLGFGKAWPGAGPVDPTAHAAPYTPPVAPYVPPAGVPNPLPTNPNIPPYNYDYRYDHVPPVSQWGAPQVPGVPSIPPYPDPAAPPNADFFHRFPSGAIWLIVLGVFFLVGRASIFHVHVRLLAPILMIGFGVWLFVSRMMSTGHTLEDDGSHYYRWRLANAVHHSVWIVLTGVIWLLDAVHILSWGRSWPIYLIGAGVLMLLRRATESPYIPYAAAPVYPPASGPVAAEKFASLGLTRTDADTTMHQSADTDKKEDR